MFKTLMKLVGKLLKYTLYFFLFLFFVQMVITYSAKKDERLKNIYLKCVSYHISQDNLDSKACDYILNK